MTHPSKRHSMIIAILVSTGMLFGAQSAWSQEPELGPGRSHYGPGSKGMIWARHLRSLDLADDQREQIREILQTMRNEVQQLRSEARSKREEMRALWLSDNPSREALMAKHAEINVIHQHIWEARMDFRLQVLTLLSAEQKAELGASLASARPHRGRGWGRGGGGGGGDGWGRGGGNGRGRDGRQGRRGRRQWNDNE